LQKVRETAIISAGTVFEAMQWYSWVKDIPQSVTRGIFLNVTGYELDGMHPQFDGILLAADDEGRSYMFKLAPPQSQEAFFAMKISGMPFMVGSSYQNAQQIDESDGSTHSCQGLLMRKFDCSLFDFHSQFSTAALLNRCKAMIIAINSLHRVNIVHMDIKEANIFVKDGNWFVGDFGSCVHFGENVRETTGGYYILPRKEVIDTPAMWHHDWFALALVFVNQLRVHDTHIETSVEGFSERVHEWINTKCEDENLKALLNNMANCVEQSMQLDIEADFVILTDGF
jgi:serine/threonine protein kinase